MAIMELTVKSKSVNSKKLAGGINNFMVDAIKELLVEGSGNWSGRDWFVELSDAFMYDVSQEGKIVQWDVVCDARNNKMSDMDAGRLNIDVYFQQYDCVNTTHLSYTLAPAKEEEDSIDWDMFN